MQTAMKRSRTKMAGSQFAKAQANVRFLVPRPPHSHPWVRISKKRRNDVPASCSPKLPAYQAFFRGSEKGTKFATQIGALFPQTAPSPAEWPGCRDCCHPRINGRKRAQPGQSHLDPTLSQTSRLKACSPGCVAWTHESRLDPAAPPHSARIPLCQHD